jgi:hypothetical protein
MLPFDGTTFAEDNMVRADGMSSNSRLPLLLKEGTSVGEPGAELGG